MDADDPADADLPAHLSRAAAAAAMAALHAARLDCQIPWRDLAPYAEGNSGIPHAFSFAATEPGPHVVVTALAHGNEPCGREALVALLQAGVRPRRGRLSLVFCNIAAHAAGNGVDPYGTRFIEEDFNRVWSAAILDGDRDSIELRRARQIRPILESADLLLDIHATPYEAAPFWPLRPGHSKARALATALGHVSTHVLFEHESLERPTISRFGRLGDPASPAVGISVECGLFFAAQAVEVAKASAARLLLHAGMVTAAEAARLGPWTDPDPPRKVLVGGPEIVASTDIRLLFRPERFQAYAGGSIVGWDGARPIRASQDGAVPLWIKQTFVAGEQAFMWGRHAA